MLIYTEPISSSAVSRPEAQAETVIVIRPPPVLPTEIVIITECRWYRQTAANLFQF